MSLLNLSPFFVCLRLSLSSIDSQGQCDKYVAEGDSFVIPVNHPLSDRLQWTHDSRVIFYRTKDTYRAGKAGDVEKDGSLKLTNLLLNQTGLYTPEIFNQETGKSAKDLKSLRLCVIGR